MQSIKARRLDTALLIIVMLMLGWGLIGLILKPIDVTLFWGVGVALIVFLIFILNSSAKLFGFWKSVGALIILFVVIFGAWILNAYRGWPFGMVYYHNILGWHILRVTWVLPVFWSLLTGAAIALTKPAKSVKDPRVLFAWAFDSAIFIMLYSILIEPLAAQLRLSTWSVQGQVLGVPFTTFLGWFVISFIASVCAITLLKLWTQAKRPLSCHLPFIMLCFHLLLLVLVIKAGITLLIFFNLIGIGYYIYKILKLKKQVTEDSLNPSFN